MQLISDEVFAVVTIILTLATLVLVSSQVRRHRRPKRGLGHMYQPQEKTDADQ